VKVVIPETGSVQNIPVGVLASRLRSHGLGSAGIAKDIKK
jgi:hypothetical protein